MAESGLWRNI